MSIAGNATFATIEEAWGPSSQLSSIPPNPFQNPSYQRQILESSAAVGITPREPQVLDAASVKTYLAQLYKESGPVAVTALLPADFTDRRPRRLQFNSSGKCFVDDWDLFWKTVRDPENLFLILVAAFAVLIIADSF